jgi:hypothetical protein
MRLFMFLAVLGVALPAFSAERDGTRAVEAALQMHFDSVQPFWDGQVVLSPTTMAPIENRTEHLISSIVKDASIAEELKSTFPKEVVLIDPSKNAAFVLGDVAMEGNLIDWKKAAAAHANAVVAFKATTPRFSDDGNIAIVRLDGVSIRGINEGTRISILYRANRQPDGSWKVSSGAGPAFTTTRTGE